MNPQSHLHKSIGQDKRTLALSLTLRLKTFAAVAVQHHTHS